MQATIDSLPANHIARPFPRGEKLLVRALLRWFARQARPLPWRRVSDPYAIWVSEVMLQQTQAQTVIPYWTKWMGRFPNVAALAAASWEEVLHFWQGLGYYRRARNLHQAARVLASEHDGKLPADLDRLWALPGIGRYTAGAICSIAFGQPAPVVDGNVARVLSRVTALEETVDSISGQQWLWRMAANLVTQAARETGWSNPCGDLNQALMELGATVCKPVQPLCQTCPIRRFCRAHRDNSVGDFPKLSPRLQTVQRRVLVFLCEHKGKLLVRQRPADVVNAGFWELPQVDEHIEPELFAVLQRQILKMEATPLAEARHQITRYSMRLQLYRGSKAVRVSLSGSSGNHHVERGKGYQVNLVWRSLHSLEELPFLTSHRKLLRNAGVWD